MGVHQMARALERRARTLAYGFSSVNQSVWPGEVHAFMGENGAGKEHADEDPGGNLSSGLR